MTGLVPVFLLCTNPAAQKKLQVLKTETINQKQGNPQAKLAWVDTLRCARQPKTLDTRNLLNLWK